MDLVGAPEQTAVRRAPMVLDVHLVGPEQLAALRRWLRNHWRSTPDALDDAQLLCTELASNALEHAPAPRSVRLVVTDAEFTAELTDGGPDSALTIGVSRLGGHRGRGLLTVNALGRWGVRRGPSGKTVWATMAL